MAVASNTMRDMETASVEWRYKETARRQARQAAVCCRGVATTQRRRSSRADGECRHERLEHPVRPPATASRKGLERQRVRQPGLVRARGRERIVQVQDAHDLRGKGNLVPFETVGIATAVVTLV